MGHIYTEGTTAEYKERTSRLRIGILIKNNHLLRLLKMQRPILKYQYLVEASKKSSIILYFFSMEVIDVRKRVINGVYYNNTTQKWEQSQYPYPEAIYKFYGSKKESFETKKLKAFLNTENIININLLYCFDKWELYKHLSKNRGLKKYLPFTMLYNGPESLKELLNEENTLYLKDVSSGKGRGIFRVEKLPNGGYSYSYFINDLNWGKARSFSELIKKINSFFNNKPFIMQAAIQLIEIENKKIDIRAELQREGSNKIILAGLIIRAGNNMSPITTHGTCYEFDSFLKKHFNYSEGYIYKLKKQIISLLRKVYLAIEEVYGPTAELSVDLGLDTHGNYWFIESNSYSGKVSYYKIYEDRDLVEAYKNILEYGQYRYLYGEKDGR